MRISLNVCVKESQMQSFTSDLLDLNWRDKLKSKSESQNLSLVRSSPPQIVK